MVYEGVRFSLPAPVPDLSHLDSNSTTYLKLRFVGSIPTSAPCAEWPNWKRQQSRNTSLVLYIRMPGAVSGLCHMEKHVGSSPTPDTMHPELSGQSGWLRTNWSGVRSPPGVPNAQVVITVARRFRTPSETVRFRSWAPFKGSTHESRG